MSAPETEGPLSGEAAGGGAGPGPGAAPGPGGKPGFFRSRWVERPEHVRELDPSALPRGFRAAGVAAGLKITGLDMGVLVSDEPATASAARFTSNARVGAPVIVSRTSLV